MNKLFLNLLATITFLFVSLSLNAQNATYKAEIESLYVKDQKFAVKETAKGAKYGENTREVLQQMKEIKLVRTENLEQAKEMIRENGFPTVSKVGEDACHKFCLVVLGLDEDVDFQMQVLRLMETAVENNDAVTEDFAYLSDRVRINMGMKQWYGTQMTQNKAGMSVPYEIENPDYVNQRRAEVNLPDMMIRETASNEKIQDASKRNTGNVRY